MTTETDVCNRSLSAIGTSTTIASLNEDSTEARQCKLLYAPTRDRVLRMARWGFARKMVNLSLLKAMPGTPENQTVPAPYVWDPATMPQFPWLYSYAYPSDGLLMQRVPLQYTSSAASVGAVPLTTATSYAFGLNQSEVASSRFTVAQDTDLDGNPIKVVLTNVDLAIGVYTVRTTNPDLFDELFTEALVAALGASLTISLTGNMALSQKQYGTANGAILLARVSDGDEGITVQDHIPDWITVRASGAGAGYGVNNLGYLCEPYAPLFSGGA